MENSLFLTVLILSWLLCDVCVHSQVSNRTGNKCLDPGPIANGYVNGSSTDSREYTPGEKLTYGCRAGYFMSGWEHLTCLDSGKWNYHRPKCYKLVTCEPPGNISDGGYGRWKDFYKSGEKVEYKCYPGYFLKGSKNLTCLKRDVGGYCGGYWDNDPPECIKEEGKENKKSLSKDSSGHLIPHYKLLKTKESQRTKKKTKMGGPIQDGCQGIGIKVPMVGSRRKVPMGVKRISENIHLPSFQLWPMKEEKEEEEKGKKEIYESAEGIVMLIMLIGTGTVILYVICKVVAGFCKDEWVRQRALSWQRALLRHRAERERAEQDGSSPAAPAEPGAWTTAASQFVGAQSKEQSGSPPIVENSMGSSPGGTEISVEQSPSSGENPLDLPTYTQAVRVKPARPALSQPEDSRSLPSYTQAIRSPTTRVPLDLMENAMEMRQWNTPTGLPTYTHAVRAEAVRPAVQSLPWDTHTTRIEISIDYDNFAPRNITSHQFEKDD